MTPSNRERPTDSQLSLLSVLWSRGPSTVREVHEALPDDLRRGYTTTLKQLQLMVEQGLALRDESQRSHVYRARVGEEETKGRLVDELLDKAFGGSAAKLVMRALSGRVASEKELGEIRALLDSIEGGERG